MTMGHTNKMGKKFFLVRYTYTTHFQGEDGISFVKNYRTIIVQADDKVDAFIQAYWRLAAQGYDVATVHELDGTIVVEGSGERIERRGVAGLSALDMERVYAAGIPKIRPYGNASIVHIAYDRTSISLDYGLPCFALHLLILLFH